MRRKAQCCGVLLLAVAGCSPDAPDSKPPVYANISDEIVVPTAPPLETTTNATDAVTPAKPQVKLAADGLGQILESGTTRQVAFGTPADTAVAGIAAVLGDPIERGDDQDCGAGQLGFATFRGGLSLYFQGGKFAGWDVDSRDGGRFATAAGIGVGATRKQIEAAAPAPVKVDDTSLGIEFAVGGVSGLLSARSPEGEVTNLWAGVTCLAR